MDPPNRLGYVLGPFRSSRQDPRLGVRSQGVESLLERMEGGEDGGVVIDRTRSTLSISMCLGILCVAFVTSGNELVDVGGSEGGCVREAVSVAVVLGDVVTARGKAEREAKGRIRRDRSEEKRGWRMIMLTSSCEQRTHQRRRRSTRERG
jgi:hypothetical protein